MRTALAALLACLVVAALAPGTARAAGCPNLSVNGGRFVGQQHLQLVRIGHVSCRRARSVTRTWFRRMATGKCGRLNNFCVLTVAGGWGCSIFSAGVSATAGGALAGCARGRARIRMYKGGDTLPLDQFLSADGKIWCVLARAQSVCFAGPPNDADPSERSATLDRDGTVTTCAVAQPSAADFCTQNWNFDAPLLDAGRRTRSHGVGCTARAGAITCKLVSGPGKGKGFRITATSAAPVSV